MMPLGLPAGSPTQGAFWVTRPARADFSPLRVQGCPAHRSLSPLVTRQRVVTNRYLQPLQAGYHQQQISTRDIQMGGKDQDSMTRADFARDGLKFYALVQNMQNA